MVAVHDDGRFACKSDGIGLESQGGLCLGLGLDFDRLPLLLSTDAKPSTTSTVSTRRFFVLYDSCCIFPTWVASLDSCRRKCSMHIRKALTSCTMLLSSEEPIVASVLKQLIYISEDPFLSFLLLAT